MVNPNQYIVDGATGLLGIESTVPTSSGLGMTGGDWISAGINLVGQGLNTYNTYQTNKTNKEISEKNYEAQVQTNALNKELTEQSWARDDSQLQRAKADALKAGFSPMAALSNNLTNSSPLQMQAPQQTYQHQNLQYDLSGLGNVFSQAAYKKQQVEALSLENQFNKETVNLRKLQAASELVKLYNDLDSQQLDNAQKASILVASGFNAADVKKLLGNIKLSKIPKNTSSDYENKLKDAQAQLATAQKSLVNAQVTTESKQQSLLEAQKALNDIQTALQTNENNYLWEQKVSMYVPVVTIEGNKAQIDWTYSDSISRRQAFDLYKNCLDILTSKRQQQEVNSDTFNKFFEALDKIIPF